MEPACTDNSFDEFGCEGAGAVGQELEEDVDVEKVF